MTNVNWNEAAEELLNSILARTPRPEREAAQERLAEAAEELAEDEGKIRVGVETLIAAWVQTTPKGLRAEIPQQMEAFGLDPEEYGHLLE